MIVEIKYLLDNKDIFSGRGFCISYKELYVLLLFGYKNVLIFFKFYCMYKKYFKYKYNILLLLGNKCMFYLKIVFWYDFIFVF